jgi:hypothetical protein
MKNIREQVLLSISKRKKNIVIGKGNWYRKDGSRWMNDRGFVEPYQNLTKIPNENRKDHTEEVGNANQVWIDNPFNNSMEMESYLNLKILLRKI